MPEEVRRKIRFSDHIFIEHAADVVSVCLCTQMAQWLSQRHLCRDHAQLRVKSEEEVSDSHRVMEVFFLKA